MIQREKSLGVPKTEMLQSLLFYEKKRSKMNDYVRNMKLYQMVEEKLVTFCCVTKLLDLQQQVFILTLMNLLVDGYFWLI